MRKLWIAAALAASLVPSLGHATEAAGKVLVATGTAVSDGNSRPARCAYAADPVTGNGVFGYVINNVTPGAEFALRATGTLSDPDIDFFKTLTPCDADANKTVFEHDNHSGSREDGPVPDGATVAIVTLRTGANVSFTYTEAIP